MGDLLPTCLISYDGLIDLFVVRILSSVFGLLTNYLQV